MTARRIEVPWDVFEAISDTVREKHPPFLDGLTAMAGHPNIVLRSSPWSDSIDIVITPQREDQDHEDQADPRRPEVATRVADAAIPWEQPYGVIRPTPHPT